MTKRTGFHCHPRCSKLAITHLCFADDLLLFTRCDISSVVALQQCFNQFSGASSLKANLGKCLIYFGGVSREDRDIILKELGLSEGELPFKYLGVPLSTKKLSLVQWQPLIERIVTRISSWTGKKLSFAGECNWCKQSYLGSKHIGLNSLFFLPKS